MHLKSEVTQEIPEGLARFSELPNSGYIRLPVVMRLYSVSASTVWRCSKNGSIPKPVKLTERTTAWNIGLIRADLAAKAKKC